MAVRPLKKAATNKTAKIEFAKRAGNGSLFLCGE